MELNENENKNETENENENEHWWGNTLKGLNDNAKKTIFFFRKKII